MVWNPRIIVGRDVPDPAAAADSDVLVGVASSFTDAMIVGDMGLKHVHI